MCNSCACFFLHSVLRIIVGEWVWANACVFVWLSLLPCMFSVRVLCRELFPTQRTKASVNVCCEQRKIEQLDWYVRRKVVKISETAMQQCWLDFYLNYEAGEYWAFPTCTFRSKAWLSLQGSLGVVYIITYIYEWVYVLVSNSSGSFYYCWHIVQTGFLRISVSSHRYRTADTPSVILHSIERFFLFEWKR